MSGAPAGASPGASLSSAAQAATQKAGRRWYKADLHTHTPASNDYEEPGIPYLQWLRMAAERGLDIVAVTDHNTVAGIAAMRREIEWLLRLKDQGRLTDSERATLAEWTELSNRVLVLPGFEFTATFGFHILGIFPPETSVRTLEHVLLTLKVPPDKIDIGSTETGSTTDVLGAYKVIRDAGGLVIAAHANSTHGVAMRNFPFGGQTKIAFTQDTNLDALEVTDLENRAHSTARFFNGSKSEYPRRMHAIQGSDAHRLSMDPRNPKRLGVGERATEFLLDDCSYEALAAVLRGTQWDRTRPARPKERAVDPLAVAREEGNTPLQSFHDSAHKQGGRLDAVLDDLCAFANTAGGTVFVGASLRREGPRALTHPKQVEESIVDAVLQRIAPPIDLQIETIPVEAGGVLRLRVSRGDERPYAVDSRRILVRNGVVTLPANRDEIVAMALESAGLAAPEPRPSAPQPAQSAAAPGSRRSQAKPRGSGTRQPSARTTASTQALPMVPKAEPPPKAVERPVQPPHVELDRAAAPPALVPPAMPPASLPPVTQATTPVDSSAGPAKRSRKKPAIPIVHDSNAAPTSSLTPQNPPEIAAIALEAAAPEKKPRSRKQPGEIIETAAPPTGTFAEAAKASLTEEPVNETSVEEPSPAAPAKAARPRRATKAKPGTLGAVVEAVVSGVTELVTGRASEPVGEVDAASVTPPAAPAKRSRKSKAAPAPQAENVASPSPTPPPQIGVEIVESESRNGAHLHTIRDLRNGNTVRGVSRKSARDLWSYAIERHEKHPVNSTQLEWIGDMALVYAEKRAGKVRYDLALRDGDRIRVFYGVTGEGMQAPWTVFLQDDDI